MPLGRPGGLLCATWDGIEIVSEGSVHFAHGLAKPLPNRTDECGDALRYLSGSDPRIILQQAPGQRLGNVLEHSWSICSSRLAQLLSANSIFCGILSGDFPLRRR